MSFNYVDAFNSSSQLEYESKQHDNAVELQGRRTYVFKLDKALTDKSEVYNETNYARVYLPHFEQRALYNTAEWQGVINLNIYEENEETMSFEYNFARMVCNIRDLKDKTVGKLTIKNICKEPLMVSTDNSKFIISSSNDVELINLDLSKYKSIKILINDILKKCSLIEIKYEGDSESALAIRAIKKRIVPNNRFSIDVEDRTYKNCTDVIEAGDVILTDKYKLYQVQNVYPSGTMVNEYMSWTAKCNTMDLAAASLPDDYRKIVERNRYNLPKVNKE